MKQTMIFLLGLIALIVLSLIWFYPKSIDQNQQLTSENVLKIIQPEIISYCNALDNNSDPNNCPTCMFYYPLNESKNYLNVSNFNEGPYGVQKYKIEKINESYLVTVKVSLIHGRNDRPGSSIISFEIDNKGQIFNKTIPFSQC